MKQRVIGCFGTLVAFSMIYAAIKILLGSWYDLSPQLAEGKNMLLLSLGILAAFAYWQYKGIMDALENPKKSRYKNLLIGMVIVGIVFVLTIGIGQNVFFHQQGTWLEETLTQWGFTGGEDLVIQENTLLNWVAVIALFFYLILIVAGGLLAFLTFGRLAMGINLAITSHNWFNGNGFDPSLFIEVIVESFGEFVVSDLIGIIVTILWFLVSTFFLQQTTVTES